MTDLTRAAAVTPSDRARTDPLCARRLRGLPRHCGARRALAAFGHRDRRFGGIKDDYGSPAARTPEQAAAGGDRAEGQGDMLRTRGLRALAFPTYSTAPRASRKRYTPGLVERLARTEESSGTRGAAVGSGSASGGAPSKGNAQPQEG